MKCLPKCIRSSTSAGGFRSGFCLLSYDSPHWAQTHRKWRGICCRKILRGLHVVLPVPLQVLGPFAASIVFPFSSKWESFSLILGLLLTSASPFFSDTNYITQQITCEIGFFLYNHIILVYRYFSLSWLLLNAAGLSNRLRRRTSQMKRAVSSLGLFEHSELLKSLLRVYEMYWNSVPSLQSHLMNTQLAQEGHADNAPHPLCLCFASLHPRTEWGFCFFMCVCLVYILKHVHISGVFVMVMALLWACQTFYVLTGRFPLRNKSL